MTLNIQIPRLSNILFISVQSSKQDITIIITREIATYFDNNLVGNIELLLIYLSNISIISTSILIVANKIVRIPHRVSNR